MSWHRPYGTWFDLIAGVRKLKRRANKQYAYGAAFHDLVVVVFPKT
jgi:hypothetical protein